MLFIIFRGAKKPRKYGIYKDFIGSFITIYWEFYYYFGMWITYYWELNYYIFVLLGVIY